MRRSRREGCLVLIGASLLVSFCVTSVEAQTAPEREWKASFAEVVRENQDAVVQVIAEVSKFEKTVHDPRCERGGHGLPFLVRIASLGEGEPLSLTVQTGEEKRTVSVVGEPLRRREVGAGG